MAPTVTQVIEGCLNNLSKTSLSTLKDLLENVPKENFRKALLEATTNLQAKKTTNTPSTASGRRVKAKTKAKSRNLEWAPGEPGPTGKELEESDRPERELMDSLVNEIDTFTE